MAGLEKIIKDCIRNDERAQKELYTLFARKLFAVCYRYSKCRADAEDLLQETFIKIYLNIKSYSGKGSFEGWMKKIAINCALKHYHNNKTLEFNSGYEGLDSGGLKTENKSAFAEDGLSSINYQELLKFIELLPEGKKIIFNLYVIEGYDHKEISEMLNISEGTSRSQLTKAREMLQEIHKKRNGVYERNVS